jgi:hypothetical protein
MGVEPLTPNEVGVEARSKRGETPLLYYILKEAEVRHAGERLSEVGGRIVAEVIVGILDCGPRTYRQAGEIWTPTLPSVRQGHFTIADLLRFDGVAWVPQVSGCRTYDVKLNW